MVEFIPFYRPEINDEDVEGVIRALKSGWLSKGPKVIEFEENLKEYLNTEHVVSCNSGTAALHLALLSLGIGLEDEVIVPSFTFCSSVNVIMHVGAKPVFVDIDEEDLCLDLHDVKRKITKKTKAIIAVHFAGYPAKLQELQKLCKEHGLFLIEDAAHALGTKYDNTLIGTHGDIICFSFYATKNITTGEGGALVTKNEEIAEKARLYGWHGITKNAWNRYGEKGSWRYDVLLPGFKYNMMDLQASLGISQLKRADEMIEKRRRIAEIYQKELKEIQEYITLPNYVNNPSIKHAWHLFIIKINPNSPISRDQMIQEMKKRNIGLSVHFIPVHMHPYYQERFNVHLPKTEEVFDQIISLPLYSALTENEVEHIVTSLKSLYQLKVGR